MEGPEHSVALGEGGGGGGGGGSPLSSFLGRNLVH